MTNSIRTNTLGSKINHHIYGSDEKIKSTMQRLSTGLRINKAADDSAGLSISERLTAQNRGLQMANRNMNDAISLVRTADGALSTMADALQRIRELTVQGRNGTLSSQDKLTIDNEISDLLGSIDKISNTTTFNGIKLLNKTPQVIESFGENWTSGTSGLLQAFSVSQNNDGSIIVASGYNTSFADKTVYSTDGGETWNTGVSRSFDAITYNGSKFIGVDYDTVFESSDGVNWNSIGNAGKYINNLYYSNGTYVGIHYAGASDYRVVSSSDAINWNEVGIQDAYLEINSLDGKFIVRKSDYSFLTSTDGTNFAPENVTTISGVKDQFSATETVKLNGVYYANDNGEVYQSTDGENWQVLKDFSFDPEKMVYNQENNTLLAISGNGQFEYTQEKTLDEPLNIHSGIESDNTYGIELSDVKVSSLGLDSLSVNDPTALQKIDAAIEKITEERTKYGIAQNRLEVKLENNSVSHISTEQTNQRISNADMSLESSVLMKEQIKNQTAMAMLQKSYAQMESKLTLLQA